MCCPDWRCSCAGFVRLAIEQGASLVPVVVLGEVDCLRNFVDVPRLQAWTYKKLGFPVRPDCSPSPKPSCPQACRRF